MLKLEPEVNHPEKAGPGETPLFGSLPELAAVEYSPPGVVVGFIGTVDDKGIAQLGVISEARALTFRRTASGSGGLSWPKVSHCLLLLFFS